MRAELLEVDPLFQSAEEVDVARFLDNRRWIGFTGIPAPTTWKDVAKGVTRIRTSAAKASAPPELLAQLDAATANRQPSDLVQGNLGPSLLASIEGLREFWAPTDEDCVDTIGRANERAESMTRAHKLIEGRLPTFVYFANYFRARPRVHLRQLAERITTGTSDPEYDFGNICLLRLLGLDAKELAEQGSVEVPAASDRDAQTLAQDRLDERMYRLNAAAVELTALVRNVWGDDAATLDFRIDGDYLKVVSRDELGVEVELDQKSEGFQWLVSFYIVFKAQAAGDLKNAILLLDEPGLSLHALKQQEFRKTVSILAVDNQTIYTTHSPFMVGPDELPLVRVVDMKSRAAGTRVHTTLVQTDDPAALFPLQAALGYSLSQSLFAQQKNLVVEGLTDYFYIDAMASALRSSGDVTLDEDVSLVPAGNASKVVYFSVLLHAQKLRVAALLDSDSAGDQAATQDNFVQLLSLHRIHRTKDYYSGAVQHPEVEDLLRESLIRVAKDELGWDVRALADSQPSRPTAQIFKAAVGDFAKYKLALAFSKWVAANGVVALQDAEREGWSKMFLAVNKSLK